MGANENFEKGQSLKEQGRYQAACQEFQKAIMIDPSNAAIHIAWGFILSAQRKHDEAIRHYQEALKVDPDNVDAQNNWGLALAAQRKYDEAIKHYQVALKVNPDNVDAHNNWGLALVARRKRREAVKHYEKVNTNYQKILERAPQDIATHIKWGKALAAQQKYAEAIAQYQNALNIDSTNVTAHVKLGNALAELKKYDDAIKHYQEALDIDSENVTARVNLGNTLAKQKKYDDAIKHYQEALSIDSENVAALLNYGTTLYAWGKYGEASSQYQKALSIDTDNVFAHNSLGHALYKQKKYDEAIEQFKKQVELDPSNKDAYFDWGNVLDNQGNLPEAIEKYEKAFDLDRDAVYAYHNCAFSLWALGDYKAARKAWERACSIYERTIQDSKNDEELFYYYGTVLYEYFGKSEKSEQVLKRGLDINPDHTLILSTLLSLYLDRHDESGNDRKTNTQKPVLYGKAREYFRKAESILKEELKSESAETCQELGDLYLKMGEYDAAEKYLTDAHKKDPESLVPCVSLGVLYSQKEDFRQAVQFFEKAHGRDRYDLNIWSNLAEVYLKLDMTEPKQIEKAEAEFRKILEIAPDHIDSRIGQGEVYTAMAENGETDFYEIAIDHYGKAIRLAEEREGSRNLKKNEIAAIYYSRGYARVQRYEASRPFGDESFLRDALRDFRRCADLNPDHSKAKIAIGKLSRQLKIFSPKKLTESGASLLVILPALFVFFYTQQIFIFKCVKPVYTVNTASYIALTFGSLIFIIVGLFLPQIQKLKGAGIEIEKSATTQITTSSSIGIKR